MALTITTDCINCDACEEECPNSAISLGPEYCQINPDRCTECVGHYDTPQCIEACPVDCIVVHPHRQESRDQLLHKYAALMGKPP